MSGNKFKETLVFPASATLAGVYFYKQHRELFISSIILNPFFLVLFWGDSNKFDSEKQIRIYNIIKLFIYKWYIYMEMDIVNVRYI